MYIKQCERVEERLRRLTSEISALYRKQKGGRQKDIFDEKVKKLAVYESEVESAEKLSTVLTSFQNSNVELENRCKILLNQLKESKEFLKETEQKADTMSRKLSELTKEKEGLLECLVIYI